MALIQTNNAHIYSQMEGQGPPVLLISGMISDVASWGPLSPLLKDNFTLINFDNRGAGRTQCAEPNWTIDHMVEDAIAVLDHYQISQAHIVGHSMGGMIGLRIAKKYPDRVAAYIMMSSVNAPTKKGVAYFEEMAKLHASNMSKTDWFQLLFHALYSPPFFDNPASVKAAAYAASSYEHAQTSANLLKQVAALASITPIKLSEILTPILSLIGQNDNVVLPHRAQTSLADLPNAVFQILPDAAHSIHWEATEKVADEITGFLNAHPL